MDCYLWRCCKAYYLVSKLFWSQYIAAKVTESLVYVRSHIIIEQDTWIYPYHLFAFCDAVILVVVQHNNQVFFIAVERARALNNIRNNVDNWVCLRR